jgi:carbonic anhydrase/acetyltransferase-like protein (isoleucine patch superfamily)
MQVPPGSLVLGIPGKIKPLPSEHAGRIARTAEHYVQRKELYRNREK